MSELQGYKAGMLMNRTERSHCAEMGHSFNVLLHRREISVYYQQSP